MHSGWCCPGHGHGPVASTHLLIPQTSTAQHNIISGYAQIDHLLHCSGFHRSQTSVVLSVHRSVIESGRFSPACSLVLKASESSNSNENFNVVEVQVTKNSCVSGYVATDNDSWLLPLPALVRKQSHFFTKGIRLKALQEPQTCCSTVSTPLAEEPSCPHHAWQMGKLSNAHIYPSVANAFYPRAETSDKKVLEAV